MQMDTNVSSIRRINTKEDTVTANQFIKHLKQYRNILPRNTIKTLKGQALSGDVPGAARGLERVLKRLEPMRGVENEIYNINRQQSER